MFIFNFFPVFFFGLCFSAKELTKQPAFLILMEESGEFLWKKNGC